MVLREEKLILLLQDPVRVVTAYQRPIRMNKMLKVRMLTLYLHLHKKVQTQNPFLHHPLKLLPHLHRQMRGHKHLKLKMLRMTLHLQRVNQPPPPLPQQQQHFLLNSQTTRRVMQTAAAVSAVLCGCVYHY
ncbi:uncharacterized protein TM35_001791010 [Trypanosoma theileri]|uniref:Uncharacterized protein n=1 Tax=Trypanosoma theileri TaxID=67003 RepID=A0A1X0NDI8_9TRYP|nr:uncharacterized protein TM35_001791010 [Trypanosoma theileri]ORC80121.1 hypothetical protein TM35_001791010 [Trypanosoma theileri]